MNYFLFLLIFIFTSTSVVAAGHRQKSLNFNIDTDKVYKGDILYSSRLVDQKKFKEKYKKLIPVDTLNFRKQKDRKILIIKSAFMVKVAPGFFNQENLLDEKFISHLQGDSQVKALSKDKFKITINGSSFIKTIYFDSDDISSVGGKKFSQAVKAVKEIDVILQSSIASLVEEDGDQKDGGVTIQSFVPLKKDKTLIIRYELISLPTSANKKSLYQAIPKNLERYQKLFQEFKVH